MKTLQFLLTLLLGAFIMTACAADEGQETAVEPIEEPMIPAASQDAPVTKNQEPTNIPVENLGTVPPAQGDPVPTAAPVLAPLPVIAPAPGWKNDTWINTESPLLLEDLRGKVVLLEFWTFG